MNTHKPKQTRSEQGITLIALIVTIIIMVILATITIRMLTDEDSIILSTQSATLDYDIAQYGEQVEELFQGIILEKWILGDDVILDEVAEEMGEESWIKTAEVDDEGTSIIVTVPEGYEYQVYYDEETGEKQIEYLGKDTDEDITLVATYNEGAATINATAECKDGVALIELIYKGETIQTHEGSSKKEEASFSVENTGWYTIRATSTKGKYKYAYVRVYTTITPPTIAVTSSGTENNGWYGADRTSLEVTISTDNTVVAGIYYKTNKDEEYTYVDGTSKVITVTDVGTTIIYAYSVDSNGYESDISSLEVKYDNVPPVVTTNKIEATGTSGSNDWYTSDVTLLFENAITDAASGVAGYHYYTGDDSSNKSDLVGLSQTIEVTSEGEIVLVIQGEDNAGNLSTEGTITVKKDSVAPSDFTPSITGETTTTFTIVSGTTDETSGVDYYDFYVDGSKVGTGTTGTYQATGLTPKQSYTVYVIAYDKAGNSKTSGSVVATTKGELFAPNIEVTSGEEGNNDYYTSNVTLKITDSADSSRTGATQIKYTITGKNAVGETTVNGREAEVTITTDGTSIITAYVVDEDGNTSNTTSTTINKDATAPTASISVETADIAYNYIIVYGEGEDATSGVYSYTFQISTTSSTSGFETVGTTTTSDTACEYKYTGLSELTTYYLRVIVTDNAGNSTTSTAVAQQTPVNNTAPVITSVGVNSKTTSSITIKATATDADGDDLTYMLYTGTSEDSLSLAATSSATTQGTQITLTQSSLTYYTTYYYRIDVTDGIAITVGDVASVRTYCSGKTLYCSGGTTTSSSKTCSTCSGSGTITTTSTSVCWNCLGDRRKDDTGVRHRRQS